MIHVISLSSNLLLPLYIHISSSCSQHFSISTVEICSICTVMGSWVRTITTPFRKACTCTPINPPRDQKKHQPAEAAQERYRMTLHGEVMACSYDDVKVMWSILDKSNSGEHSSSR